MLEKLLIDYDESLNHSGISGTRVAQRLAALSEIGQADNGASHRIAFSKEERQAKELVKTWMNEANLLVSEDGVGNVIGRIHGKTSEKVILSGSHVDSVPNGGHFDGPLGVISSLEVAESWKETGFIPDKSYEVIIFSDEEGARFNGGFTGSAAMTGDINLHEKKHATDFNGRPFEDVIGDEGLSLQSLAEAKRDLNQIDAFVEVHIEQGKQLESRNIPVGIVTGIAGPTWLKITFTGEAGHAGNTPMNDRKDALIAASSFITKVKEFPPTVNSTAVATVGKVDVSPNGVNIIPGQVKLTVDIRDIQADTRDQVRDLIVAEAENCSTAHDIDVSIQETMSVEPVVVSQEMQEIAGKAVKNALGLTPFYLPSGAGHDAMVMGRHVPMAMLFTQSKDGISHNPKEWSTLNDCVQTIHVLKYFIEQLCKEHR